MNSAILFLRNIENSESARVQVVQGTLYRRCLVCDGLLNWEESREFAQVTCCPTKRTNIEAHEKTETIEKMPM